MTLVEAKAKRVGNSLAVFIPHAVASAEHIEEDKTVRFLILHDSRKALRETFGMLKGWKKSAQQIKDELRAELYDDD